MTEIAHCIEEISGGLIYGQSILSQPAGRGIESSSSSFVCFFFVLETKVSGFINLLFSNTNY